MQNYGVIEFADVEGATAEQRFNDFVNTTGIVPLKVHYQVVLNQMGRLISCILLEYTEVQPFAVDKDPEDPANEQMPGY